ncbi:PfkB family carbohydrate kinase, partial [Streptomyces sp. NPDC005065]|uniref:PfkB family carbohydrate kinase n=1 Tax=unclassified Streptomyces TaxID=2593676 RepID=UPI0033B68646
WEPSTFYGPGWPVARPNRLSEKPRHLWRGGVTEGILALSDLIFVNHREFKALADYTVGESDEVLAARLVERIVPTATVFVTKRYDAVDVFRKSATGAQARRFQLRRPLREISVEDATGAGDVFSASVLAARVSRPLQVELGARLSLGVMRRRSGRESSPAAPAEASLVQAPEDLTGPGSRPSAVLVAHEGESTWAKLDRFLTEDLDLPVRGIDLSAPSTPDPGDPRPRIRGPVTEAQLARCGFAVCVLGATRTMAGGSRRAGETVVHQVGILQGSYGFGRVAILVEEGCEAPSNIAGLIRLDFPSGRIEFVFWELERMLEREGFLHGRRPGEQ